MTDQERAIEYLKEAEKNIKEVEAYLGPSDGVEGWYSRQAKTYVQKLIDYLEREQLLDEKLAAEAKEIEEAGEDEDDI